MTWLQKCYRGLRHSSFLSIFISSIYMTWLQKCYRGLRLTHLTGCSHGVQHMTWLQKCYRGLRHILYRQREAIYWFMTWLQKCYRGLRHFREFSCGVSSFWWPDYRNVIGDWNDFYSFIVIFDEKMTWLQKCYRGLKRYVITFYYFYFIYDLTTEML